MEPSTSPFEWSASSSVGIDEETLRELLELDTFSLRDSQIPQTVDEGFVNAYMEELRGRRLSLPDPLSASKGEEGFPGPSTWSEPQATALFPPTVPELQDPSFLPQLNISSGMGFPYGVGPQEDPFSLQGGAVAQPPARQGSGSRKKRLRTPQQQELNKLAQQRYRERRKQKYTSLEAEVEALRTQLEALRQVESKNIELLRRNKFLEKMVSMQHQEIALLKSQLLLPPRKEGETGSSSEAQSRPRSPEELLQELETHSRALKQFLDSNNITRGDAQVSQESRQLVSRIITAVCDVTVCLTVLSVPKVEEVVDRDVHSMRKAHMLDELQPCIKRMHLSRDQVSTILHMRADHLTRMRGLYEKRQKLNMQAMSLMLPHPLYGQGHPYDPSVDGKINCMGRSGYRDCSKGEELLKVILNEVKDNLQTEQRSYFELQVALLQSILNPIQAALMIVHWQPDLVDALAFSNAVAAMHGDQSLDEDEDEDENDDEDEDHLELDGRGHDGGTSGDV